MAMVVRRVFVFLFSDFVDLFRLMVSAIVISIRVACVVKVVLLFFVFCLCFWFAVIVVLLLM